LAELTGGRAVAGLGPGGFEVKTELRVASRSALAATREAVDIIRHLLNGERLTLDDGRCFPVAGVGLGFRPSHRVPIYLAARGPRMLALAGEVADGAITHGLSAPYLDLVANRVREGAQRSGRDPSECTVLVMVEVAIGPREEALDALRPRCLFMIGGSYDESLIPLYGLDPEPVGRLRVAVREREPTAVDLIDRGMVEAFALGGQPEDIAEGLSRLAAKGVDGVILSAWRGIDADSIAELWRIAELVSA
jgi:5,10-methylenetetrahydromethanopterin reductase